jgi:hypothetical protein
MSAKCTDCGRKIATSIRGTQLCEACLEYAEWENTHSDDDHANNWKADSIEGCPVCEPAMDPRKPRREIAGTSRQGMTMVVSLRADATTKATQVKGQLPAGFRPTLVADLASGVVLSGQRGPKNARVSFVANWDHAGRWTGGTVNGRKVRNAKELLRVLAAA